MVQRECKTCGVAFKLPEAWVRKGGGRYCSRTCKAKARVGNRNSNWKGGKHYSLGYEMIRDRNHHRAHKDGGVFAHIKVMESHLGYLIPRGYEIHHKDGNRANNNISNLMLFKSSKEHKLQHAYNRIEAFGGHPLFDKICSTCHKLKDKNEFFFNKNTWDGRANNCKICNKRKG